MFTAGSLIQAVNVYLVENIIHSAVALGVVMLLVSSLRIKDAALRCRLFLLAIVIPSVSSPLYYLVFPLRPDMPVLSLDRFFSIRGALESLPYWPTLSWVLSLAIIGVASLLLIKGIITLATLVLMPRRYRRIEPGEHHLLDVVLERLTARAQMARPVVLLSKERRFLCCTFSIQKPYLLLSQGLLDGLQAPHLEAVLAHELAHIQRHDSWLDFLLLTYRNILFFNPLIHRLCDMVLQEAEMACDGLALKWGQEPLICAESLVQVSRGSLMPTYEGRLIRSGFINSRGALKRRVLHILSSGFPHGSRWKGATPATAVVLAGALFFLC